jgi:uncharacterized protein YggE
MKSATKAWVLGIGIVLLLSVAIIVTKIVFFPTHVANKAVDTAHGVVDKTLNADNAISNYEMFKDLYNSAKAQAQNIKNTQKSIDDLKAMYGDPSTWSKDIREEYNYLRQNLDGYLMQYQSIVKEYNSNSSKINRNLFKDKNLPSELPLDYTQLQ